jgi:hypothetical protein
VGQPHPPIHLPTTLTRPHARAPDLNSITAPGIEANEKRDPTAILADWPVMTLDERRQVIRDYIAKVTVHRARPGTQGFDRDRVRIQWR